MMKVKIDIPQAAETQRKRNEALEMAMRSLVNDEYVDAIMNEVMIKEFKVTRKMKRYDKKKDSDFYKKYFRKEKE